MSPAVKTPVIPVNAEMRSEQPVASRAIRSGDLPTMISSIDPHPHAAIDALCQRKIRAPLEDWEVAVFDELGPGDILFFDGSHQVFMNSDVTVFFLQIIPRLKSGVMVHVHDIFLPADYPPDWNQSLFAEQYLLAATMLCGAPPVPGDVPELLHLHRRLKATSVFLSVATLSLRGAWTPGKESDDETYDLHTGSGPPRHLRN